MSQDSARRTDEYVLLASYEELKEVKSFRRGLLRVGDFRYEFLAVAHFEPSLRLRSLPIATALRMIGLWMSARGTFTIGV